jgi:hypothetical protein
MYILSIDVGIINLGIVGGNFDETFKLHNNSIDFCKLINITQCTDNCNSTTCTLHHDSCITDHMKHVFQKYSQQFNRAQLILVERQPLQGIMAVQELILCHFRNKTKLISPNSMHAHFGINVCDYDKRKEYVVKLATPYLNNFKEFTFNTRKHDMADALCILMFYMYGKHNEYEDKRMKDEWKKINHKFIKNMNQFVYTPPQ